MDFEPPLTADHAESIHGAADQPHTTIAGAGHFLQEDRGEELANVVVDVVQRTS